MTRLRLTPRQYPARLLAALALAACSVASADDSRPPREQILVQPAPAVRPVPADSVRFIQHPEHIQAGFPLARPRFATLNNPRANNADAAKIGAQLFVAYNCIDCHGADGSGAMGPSLADGRWHFGGADGQIFASIYEGRPDGMPSWGGRIADDQIWMLVAYLKSLEKGKNVSTENFKGATVERTGH